jgi:hypothetical protein
MILNVKHYIQVSDFYLKMQHLLNNAKNQEFYLLALHQQPSQVWEAKVSLKKL